MASEATRDALIEAAKRVMQRDGAAHLTLDAVAREAGVSKGGLLYHFPSKGDLLRGMLDAGLRMQEAEMARTIGTEGKRGDFARGYLTHSVLGGKEDFCRPPAEAVWSFLGAAANDPTLLEPARAMHERWQARLEADLDDPDLATLFHLVGHGLWSAEVFGFAAPDEARRNRILARLVRMANLENMEEK